MKFAKICTVGFFIASLAVIGCSQQNASNDKTGSKSPSKSDAKTEKTEKTGKTEHVHGKGPHDGVVFDLGKYHAEFTVNHDKKTCTIYMLGDDEKTAIAVDAKELTLTTKATKTEDKKDVPAMTITLTPKDAKDGKATTFSGGDPGLGNVADFEGTVLGEIDGKPAQGDFKEEEHGHDHDHDDDHKTKKTDHDHDHDHKTKKTDHDHDDDHKTAKTK